MSKPSEADLMIAVFFCSIWLLVFWVGFHFWRDFGTIFFASPPRRPPPHLAIVSRVPYMKRQHLSRKLLSHA
jgi:hypothetical protein